MKCEHGITPWWDCDPCRGSATFGDEPTQPYVDEHIAPGGTDVGYDSEGNRYYGHRITTRGERRRIMSKHHLDYEDVSRKKRGKVYICLGGK